MKSNRDLTRLSKYSTEHQTTVVKILIEDEEYRHKTNGLFDTNSLNADDALRTIANMVYEYDTNGVNVDYRLIRTKLTSSIKDEIRLERCLAFIENMENDNTISPDTVNFIKDDINGLLIFQEARRMFGKMNEALKKEDVNTNTIKNFYKEYEDRVTSLDSTTFVKVNPSIEYAKAIIERNRYEYVPTSSVILNSALGGGLRKGDVGLLIAGSGVAKTCVTTSFVCGNAKNGQKVAHFVLEDKEDDIIKKYIAYITNIECYDHYIRREEVYSTLQQKQSQYEEMLNNIRGVYACKNNGQIKEMSVSDIDRELDRMIRSGFNPDMVVVDYYDRLKKTERDIWKDDEKKINDLLNLATKYNVALWLPTQGGKAAQSKFGELDLTSMAGGVWKTYGAQIVIAFQHKQDDDINNYTVSILKNRYYNKIKEFKCSFLNGTCKFNNDMETLKRMNEENECIDEMFDDYKVKKALQVKNENR